MEEMLTGDTGVLTGKTCGMLQWSLLCATTAYTLLQGTCKQAAGRSETDADRCIARSDLSLEQIHTTSLVIRRTFCSQVSPPLCI